LRDCKTHLAAAIGHGLTEQGIRVRHYTTTALVQRLQQAREQLQLEDPLQKLDKYRVLILDDFGYVKKSDQETYVLFELIAHRYETGSLIITSNQPFSEWDSIFPDEMMTVAAIDRLVHHANLIEVRSDSYRRKAAMRQMDRETEHRHSTVIVAKGTNVATITPQTQSPRAINNQGEINQENPHH